MASTQASVSTKVDRDHKADFYRLCAEYEGVTPSSVLKSLLYLKYLELKVKEQQTKCQ